MNSQKYPELVNFIGFNEEDVEMDTEENEKNAIFEKHLEYSEMVVEIKKGRFFQGRLNVSRVNMDEATVNVPGLN